MKYAFKSLFIFLAVSIFFQSFVFSAELAAPGTAARKFQRGLLNIALSPVEVSHELDKEKKRDTFLPSWMLGTLRGSFFAAGRALTGALETVTFFIPFPGHYGPIIEPEFPSDHLPQDKS